MILGQLIKRSTSINYARCSWKPKLKAFMKTKFPCRGQEGQWNRGVEECNGMEALLFYHFCKKQK